MFNNIVGLRKKRNKTKGGGGVLKKILKIAKLKGGEGDLQNNESEGRASKPAMGSKSRSTASLFCLLEVLIFKMGKFT